MKKLITFLVLTIILLSNHAFSQNVLISRDILVKSYKIFSETPEVENFLKQVNKHFAASEDWSAQEKRLILNMIFLYACDFATLTQLKSDGLIAIRPVISVPEIKLAITKYDTFLTRPCMSITRIVARKEPLLKDFLVYTGDVQKLEPIVREDPVLHMMNLWEHDKFYDMYNELWGRMAKSKDFGLVKDFHGGNFLRLDSLISYMKVNFVLGRTDSEIRKGFEGINKKLKVSFK
jgi:hypothetical protein